MTDAKSQTTGGKCPAEHGGKMSDCAAYPACACDYADMDQPLIHVITHATEQDRPAAYRDQGQRPTLGRDRRGD